MITTLFFADAHVEANQDLSRASLLSQFILDIKPDNIVDLGDTFSLSAISGWDLSKKLTMESRRYAKEVDAAKEWTERLFSPIVDVQDRQRRNKTKIYKPFMLRMRGNHEFRESRYVEQNPELDGMFDIDGLSGYSSHFDVVCEYRERYKLNGLNIMHCPITGNDQPISGLHIPYKTLQRFDSHSIFGHYHRHEQATNKRVDSETHQICIICPCFFTDWPHYLSPNAPVANTAGVLLVNQMTEESPPEVHEYSMEYLQTRYQM